MSPLEKLPNFREVAGVRSGLLYRSSDLSRLTPRDAAFLQSLGIGLICDLRSPAEVRRRPPRLPSGHSFRVVNLPLVDRPAGAAEVLSFLFRRNGEARFREFCRDFYRRIVFENPASIRDAVRLLSTPRNLPALLHCAGGKDRTGFLAALLQVLAGVPYDAVREDYLRTNDSYPLPSYLPGRVVAILKTHGEYLDEAFGEIAARHGSIEDYLAACGVEPAELADLKSRLA